MKIVDNANTIKTNPETDPQGTGYIVNRGGETLLVVKVGDMFIRYGGIGGIHDQVGFCHNWFSRWTLIRTLRPGEEVTITF